MWYCPRGPFLLQRGSNHHHHCKRMQKNRINIKYDVPVIEPLRYHVGLGARKGDEGRNKRSFTFRPISFRKKQNNVPQNSPQPMHGEFVQFFWYLNMKIIFMKIIFPTTSSFIVESNAINENHFPLCTERNLSHNHAITQAVDGMCDRFAPRLYCCCCCCGCSLWTLATSLMFWFLLGPSRAF